MRHTPGTRGATPFGPAPGGVVTPGVTTACVRPPVRPPAGLRSAIRPTGHRACGPPRRPLGPARQRPRARRPRRCPRRHLAGGIPVRRAALARRIRPRRAVAPDRAPHAAELGEGDRVAGRHPVRGARRDRQGGTITRFQRYVAHLPAAGEIVLFDRSWYNRAGVGRAMGFAQVRATVRLPGRGPRRRHGPRPAHRRAGRGGLEFGERPGHVPALSARLRTPPPG